MQVRYVHARYSGPEKQSTLSFRDWIFQKTNASRQHLNHRLAETHFCDLRRHEKFVHLREIQAAS